MQPSIPPFPYKPKPQLSSLLKSQTQESGVEDRIQYFFRYHPVSLIKGCKKNCYEDKSKVKSTRPTSLDQKHFEEAIINSLNKQVMTKSKYRHREKINFQRCQALKVLKYKLEEVKEIIGSKEYEELYEDLEDGEKKEEQRKFELDANFNDQMFKNYRKKHSIPPNQRIFIVTNYPDLATYFQQQGWYENPDTDSLIYDFKFITKARNIDNTNIKESQITNHFEKSNCLTTKYGLCRNLKNLILVGEDPDEFYPRCYDLYDVAEFEDWIEEFKFSKVVAILKSALELSQEELVKNRGLLRLCLECGKRYGVPAKHKIAMIENKKYPVISAEEWQCISNPKTIASKPEQQEISVEAIKNVLNEIQKVDIQFNINKQNIWIVKPGSKSRGRGIKAFSDLKEIVDYVAGRDDVSWVVQKYLQNPLIIKNRKFDIRQWVIVTDFKPLRIWAYKEFYIRFSAEEYSAANIKNRFAHLTNNSVAKYSQNFENDQIKGYMYFESQLSSAIQQITGKDLLPQIKKQIQEIVTKSIRSVSEMILYRKNSLEIFGYDFMIDTDMRPWLIEVNSSPSMEHSTHVTEKLVPEALRGFGKMVTEYMLGGRQLKDTIGGWQLIYNK